MYFLRIIQHNRYKFLGKRISLHEQVQQLVRLAEGAVGGEEGAQELGLDVGVVGEALDELDQGAAPDLWHVATRRRARRSAHVLEHDVVVAVGLGEPVSECVCVTSTTTITVAMMIATNTAVTAIATTAMAAMMMDDHSNDDDDDGDDDNGGGNGKQSGQTVK